MHLLTLQTALDESLHVVRFVGKDDQNGLFLPSDRPVHRLGLALEPFPELLAWVASARLDALFLHRPWRLADPQRASLLADGIGVLAYHLAFDECLTTGLNPALAEACGWGLPKPLGEKEGRPLGMVCILPVPLSFEEVVASLEKEFGGPLHPRHPRHLRPNNGICGNFPVEKIGVFGAMTDRLVRDAHAAGVDVYVTGQARQPAARAVEETGLGVIVLGHQRSEIWGLRTLAARLRTQFPALEIVLPPGF